MRMSKTVRDLTYKAGWVTAIVLVAGGLFAFAQSAKSKGQEVTMTGRIVDVYCAMTGDMASADHAKCTRECIMSGVPAALETEMGIVLLGKGNKGATKLLVPLAYQEVEVSGRLFEKDGLKYLDIGKINATTNASDALERPIGGDVDQDDESDE